MKEFGIIARIEDDPKPFGKQTFFFKDMITMGEHLPIKVYVFSPLDWIKGKSQIKAYEYVNNIWQNKKIEIPNIIYDRFTAKAEGEEEQYSKFIRYLETNEYNFSIPNDLIDLLKDKLKFHRFLENNHIPTLSGIRLSEMDKEHLFSLFEYNDTIYIKPVRGSGGQGISILELIENKFLLKSSNESIEFPASEILSKLKSIFPPDLFFIQSKAHTIDYNNSPYDIRVLIQNDGKKNYHVNGMAVRLGQKNSWVSNLNAGGKGIALETMDKFFRKSFKKSSKDITNEITNLCMKCCSQLCSIYGDFAEIAFDILMTKDLGPIIIEGNSKPARWIFNSIADSYNSETEEYKLYKNLRYKTVIFPLVFGTNQNFNNMEAQIELVEGNPIDLNELNNWIIDEKIDKLKVEKVSIPDNTKMSGIDTAILLYYLSIPVLKEVITLIGTWVSERKPKAKVKFTDKRSGISIEIDTESIKNVDKVIDELVNKI